MFKQRALPYLQLDLCARREFDGGLNFAHDRAKFKFQENNPPRPTKVAGTLLGMLYVSFLCSYTAKLMWAWGDSGFLNALGSTGRRLFIYLIVVVKSADNGAFFFGSKWGRHKLIPRISPAKTWEGFVGGTAIGLSASLIFFLCIHGRMGALTLHLHDAMSLGVVLSMAGMTGDLVESHFKRMANTKDSGHIFPGMGGWLDLLDSLLISAPWLYFYARLFLSVACP